MKGNVIVGQSGGPTAAINSSLAGVYRTAIDRRSKESVRNDPRNPGTYCRNAIWICLNILPMIWIPNY